MSRHGLRRRLQLAALGTCVALTAACKTDRAIFTEPIGSRILGARLVPDGRNLPGGVVTFSDDSDSLVVTITGVEALREGAYHVWLGNIAGDTVADVVPATGTISITTTDTTFNAEGDPDPSPSTVSRAGASFAEGGSNVTIRLAVALTDAIRARELVYVTIEGTNGATTPTNTGPRPLFANLGDLYHDEDTFEQSLSFGTFDPKGGGDSSYVFVPTGRGYANFIGNAFTVADSALMRPPVGYYYATSLIGRNETNQPIDTLVVGEQTAPAPDRAVSLRDADVQTLHRVVIAAPQPQILAAANRLDATRTNPFAGFTEEVVHLEAKQGIAAVSPTYILMAPIPAPVTTPGEGQ